MDWYKWRNSFSTFCLSNILYSKPQSRCNSQTDLATNLVVQQKEESNCIVFPVLGENNGGSKPGNIVSFHDLICWPLRSSPIKCFASSNHQSHCSHSFLYTSIEALFIFQTYWSSWVWSMAKNEIDMIQLQSLQRSIQSFDNMLHRESLLRLAIEQHFGTMIVRLEATFDQFCAYNVIRSLAIQSLESLSKHFFSFPFQKKSYWNGPLKILYQIHRSLQYQRNSAKRRR